jgi:hypothetical protein
MDTPATGPAQLPPAVAVPTKGDIRAQDFDAAEKAGCSIGGGSTAIGPTDSNFERLLGAANRLLTVEKGDAERGAALAVEEPEEPLASPPRTSGSQPSPTFTSGLQ